MRRVREPTFCSTPSIADARPRSSWMFGAFRAGIARPGASGSAAYPATVWLPPCPASATASTRLAVISTATAGGGLPNHEAEDEGRWLIRRTSPC